MIPASFAYPARRVQVGWTRPPLPARQLAEWAAFEHLHGPLLVQERIDAAAAMICTVLANLFSKRSYSPSDFTPRWDGEPEQTDEDIIAVFRSLQTRKEQP